ncbi:hypothetical protein FA95DRAFT_1549622 [Auriscalpium vulgare]|uniref:Uncharacterized protein n=1 Tax=Auriscalpium vulgare TaxID=40419 RepID=A0ACB8RAK6_9AGAM|nr:hypothetical protein FA95DRAFT_1549622 [Auriscalpium vulgare]
MHIHLCSQTVSAAIVFAIASPASITVWRRPLHGYTCGVHPWHDFPALCGRRYLRHIFASCSTPVCPLLRILDTRIVRRIVKTGAVRLTIGWFRMEYGGTSGGHVGARSKSRAYPARHVRYR